MGYQTRYEISIASNPEHFASINSMICAFDGPYEIENYTYGSNHYWQFDARFWDDMKDMYKLSKRFPAILFELNAQGDEVEDRWRLYFKDGCYQFCKAQIVFEPFEKEKMSPFEEESKL